MISISPELQAKIDKLRGRQLKAKVKIDYSDINIDNTIEASSTGAMEKSRIEQTYNGKEQMSYKWLSADGSCTLDGSYHPMPVTEAEYEIYEVGWWSDISSGGGGQFSALSKKMYGRSCMYGTSCMYTNGEAPPELMLFLVSRTFTEIRVSFDDKRNEFAVDFDITFINSSQTRNTIEIRGNTGTTYSSAIATQNDIIEIRLKILTWSNESRNAKVAEFLTSVSETYTGTDILNMKITEVRELTDRSPVGSTASGQCVISLVNKNRKFDYDNTESTLYGLIRENVRIRPFIGDGTEWIPLGVYYAKAWDISKRLISATVTGLDRMALLGETDYTNAAIITAPADTEYIIDTDPEFLAGDIDNLEVSSGVRLYV